MGLIKPARRSAEAFAPALPQACLTDPDPDARRRAVQAMASEEEAIETLIRLLRSDADNSVRQAAFSALGAIDSPDAARAMAAMLDEPDQALRTGALAAIAARPDHAALLLEPLGHNADPEVRGFAVLLAAGLPGQRGADFLIALAARETDAQVCARLAEALATAATEARGAPAGSPSTQIDERDLPPASA